MDELHELLVFAHKVGLGVDFHHNAHTVDDGGISGTLGGDAVTLLDGGGQALLPEILHGLVHVAVSLHQSLLALHHAHAGLFPEGLHFFCGNCHINDLLLIFK